jgi:AcrR family transcriptional regulator
MSECLPWQRARSEDQKEQRELTILNAAAELFDAHRFEEITFAMIGKQAKFTRSNLYRYFKTKEEVFIRLLAKDIDQWQARVLPVILAGKLTRSNFVSAWVPLMMESPRLMRLYDILANVLEENASDDAVREFKRETHGYLQNLIDALIDNKLFSSAEGLMKFMTSQMALAGGMYPKLHMSERLHRLSAEQGMAYSRDFYQGLLLEASESLYQSFS